MLIADSLTRAQQSAPATIQWTLPHEGTVIGIDDAGRALVNLDGLPRPIACTILRPYATITDDGDTVHDHGGGLTPPEGPITVTDLVRVLVVFADGRQDRPWVVGRA